MIGAQLVQRVATLRPTPPIILATGYGELLPGFDGQILKGRAMCRSKSGHAVYGKFKRHSIYRSHE